MLKALEKHIYDDFKPINEGADLKSPATQLSKEEDQVMPVTQDISLGDVIESIGSKKKDRYAAFLARKKAQGLIRKYVWIKMPRHLLRKFSDWISAQDPEALRLLVERGSPHDLRCLWDYRDDFEYVLRKKPKRKG